MFGCEEELLSEIGYLRDKVDSLEKKNKRAKEICTILAGLIMEDMEIKEEIKTPPKPDMRIKGRLGNP